MSASQSPSYDQPTKDKARRLSLTHAVGLVTSRRHAAAIVPADHPERVREALLNSEIEGDQLAAPLVRRLGTIEAISTHIDDSQETLNSVVATLFRLGALRGGQEAP